MFSRSLDWVVTLRPNALFIGIMTAKPIPMIATKRFVLFMIFSLLLTIHIFWVSMDPSGMPIKFGGTIVIIFV